MLDWIFPDPLPPGTPAPEFTLPDQDGNVVKLSSLRGHNVVLIFYPGDDTTVCRRQLCDFRDLWGLAQEKKTLVFGVNPQGAKSHAKFRDKCNLPFPLLVDRGQRVGQLYHARGLIVRRTVYLIDPEGVIRFAGRGVPKPSSVLATAV